MSDTAAADDPKAAEEEQAQKEQQDLEATARKQGWVPKDEFRGPEEDWRDAKAFVEFGDNEQKKLKREKADLETRLAESGRVLKETQETLKEFKGHHERVEKRAYERALTELKAEQRAAVKEGDEKAFDATEKKIDALNKEVAEAKPKANSQTPPEDHPEFAAWKRDNDWYTGTSVKNLRMRKFCDDMAEYVADANPGLKGRAFFDQMTELVKDEFPAYFENTRRNGPSAVESAGSNAPTPKGKQTYESLPADAKATCDRFIAEGLIKDRKEYCEHYEWE